MKQRTMAHASVRKARRQRRLDIKQGCYINTKRLVEVNRTLSHIEASKAVTSFDNLSVEDLSTKTGISLDRLNAAFAYERLKQERASNPVKFNKDIVKPAVWNQNIKKQIASENKVA